MATRSQPHRLPPAPPASGVSARTPQVLSASTRRVLRRKRRRIAPTPRSCNNRHILETLGRMLFIPPPLFRPPSQEIPTADCHRCARDSDAFVWQVQLRIFTSPVACVQREDSSASTGSHPRGGKAGHVKASRRGVSPQESKNQVVLHPLNIPRRVAAGRSRSQRYTQTAKAVSMSTAVRQLPVVASMASYRTTRIREHPTRLRVSALADAADSVLRFLFRLRTGGFYSLESRLALRRSRSETRRRWHLSPWALASRQRFI
jgi:hypothetical protein